MNDAFLQHLHSAQAAQYQPPHPTPPIAAAGKLFENIAQSYYSWTSAVECFSYVSVREIILRCNPWLVSVK